MRALNARIPTSPLGGEVTSGSVNLFETCSNRMAAAV